MNLRQVEIFCAVMRCRTTIAAAYELGISQPAISNAIKHLEAQIGMELFERAGNRLVPTVEAVALYRDAEPLHAMSQAIARKVRDMRDTKRGHFRVLTTNALMRSMIAPTLAEFLRTRADVQVFFDVRRMEGVIESVESGYADLGFAIEPPPRPGITMQPMATGAMVAVLPSNHPLTSKKELTPADIDGHALVGLEQTSRLGRIIRESFNKLGSPYMPNVEVRHCTTACTLVEQGLGIAIVDPFSVEARHNWQIAVRPFTPAISVSACVMYLAERPISRMGKRFIQLAQGSQAVSRFSAPAYAS